jgi:hypothetical protein
VPIHVEELTSEVTVVDGDLPLGRDQIEAIVRAVLARLAERTRDAARNREATRLRRQLSSPVEVGE